METISVPFWKYSLYLVKVCGCDLMRKFLEIWGLNLLLGLCTERHYSLLLLKLRATIMLSARLVCPWLYRCQEKIFVVLNGLLYVFDAHMRLKKIHALLKVELFLRIKCHLERFQLFCNLLLFDLLKLEFQATFILSEYKQELGDNFCIGTDSLQGLFTISLCQVLQLCK